MKMKWAMITLVTVIALAISWQWGLAITHWPLVHLWGNETDVEKIRAVMPHRIINPERIQPGAENEVVARWLVAETKARMGIIAATWCVSIAGIIFGFKKSSQQSAPRVSGTRGTPAAAAPVAPRVPNGEP